MRPKTSRGASFAIIAAVYILATLLGFFTYSAVSGQLWLRILVADVVATILVFIFSCIFSNASVYDPYWSVQPPIILTALAIGKPSPAIIVLLAMVYFWAIRLTANWIYTFSGFDYQDWRYTMLKEKTGSLYPFVNFAGIHMFPTLVVFACILPAIFVLKENPQFSPLCLIGSAVSIGAVVLQLVSDTQMHRYRLERKTPFIETGLWRYARHPNYLGEILMWWGVAIYAICLLGFRWYFILGAAVNNLMFLFISIPMAENRQAMKPGFDEYKRGKHVLLPIPFGKRS